MQINNFKSLTDYVNATPKFGPTEYETYRASANQVLDQAENVILYGDRAPNHQQAVDDMRDLQQSLRAGFPVHKDDHGSRIQTNKLPYDLSSALPKINETMPLYMTLAIAGTPAAAAITMVNNTDSKQITLQTVSPVERGMQRLENIREEFNSVVFGPLDLK
jgi:hypothetical protein